MIIIYLHLKSKKVVDEYNLKHKIYNHNLSHLTTSSSKTLIALALDNGQVRFIDISSGSFTHTLKAHHQSNCVCVQWSPTDENILCSAGSDGRIGLWDIRSSKSCLMYLDYERNINSMEKYSKTYSITTKCVAHTGPIISLAFTKDGRNIISLGKDNSLRLWDSSNGINTLVNYGRIPLNSVAAESSIQMSCTDNCDPSYVYVPAGNNLLMFNIMNGDHKQTYKGHFESINCCFYNPQLNEFYTGSKDRNILIWSKEKSKNLDDDSDLKKINSGNTNIGQPKNLHSLLANTGRSINVSSVSANESNRESNERPMDNWSDDDDS
jgi:DNA excision repair protein ERCC-8